MQPGEDFIWSGDAQVCSQRYGQGNWSQHQQRSHDRTWTSHAASPKAMLEISGGGWCKNGCVWRSGAAEWVWYLNITGFWWVCPESTGFIIIFPSKNGHNRWGPSSDAPRSGGMHLTLEVGSTTSYILIYPFWTPGRTRIHAVWPSFFPSRLRILSLYLDGRGMGTSACQPQVFHLKKSQLNGFNIIITYNL